MPSKSTEKEVVTLPAANIPEANRDEAVKYRDIVRGIYASIPIEAIYLNSRSSIDFTYESPRGVVRRFVDPMLSSVIVSSMVPKSCVLYRGGHGGGKTSMIEHVTSRLYDIPRKEISEAMIRGNDDQNVNTLLAAFKIGKLISKGEEEIIWRKFVTCPVKIIDEVNRFPPTAHNSLFEILNMGRVEFADQIYSIADYAAFATENPNDVGTYPMSRPFLDRFGLCIPVPQLPSAEDLMELCSRKDDKVYGFKENGRKLSASDSIGIEKYVANQIHLELDTLLYMIYLGEGLATCERGDFSDKSHSELGLAERCKGCGYETSETLCRMTEEGFSGRAFLDMQRWGKAYSFFMDAFKDPNKPEVQLSMIEALVPYLLYHRVTPNDSIFTKDPFFGRRLGYLQNLAERGRKAFLMVKEPLLEVSQVLDGKVEPKKAKVYDAAKKDLVVREHFVPIVEACKDPQFRVTYERIKAGSLTMEDVSALEIDLTFHSEFPPRARAFLRNMAKTKVEGGQVI